MQAGARACRVAGCQPPQRRTRPDRLTDPDRGRHRLVRRAQPCGVLHHDDPSTGKQPGVGDPPGAGGAHRLPRPRIRPAEPVTIVELPREPPLASARKLPVVPLLVPVVLGVVMALVSSPLFLLFTLMSPLIAFSTWVSDRRSGRTAAARAGAEHAVALAAARQRAGQACVAETVRRRADCPDPAVLLRAATGPGHRLWERRRGDDDALLLRVGTGPGRARAVRLTGDGAPGQPPSLTDVPIVLPLRELGVLGLAGPPATTRALGRWLVGQAAACTARAT